VVPRRFLASEVMASAAVFGKDTEAVGAPINSIFEPKVYELYRGGLGS